MNKFPDNQSESWILYDGETITFRKDGKIISVRSADPKRTPWQLFKASVAITAGVLFTVGLVLFASRSLEYIKTFF